MIIRKTNNHKSFNKSLQITHSEENAISTGLKELDNIIMLDDSDNGKLITLASRPGMGKTTLALQIALNVVASSKKDVLFYSLELSEKQVYYRIDGMIKSYSKSSEKCASNKSRIIVDDTAELTSSAIAERINGNADKPALVVIDYFQLMCPFIKKPFSKKLKKSKKAKLLQTTSELSEISKELNIPILVLSQLPRYIEGRKNKRPKISDLNIAEKSDIVIMLYRDNYYSNVYNENSKSDKSELIVAKNRFGKCGTIEFKFNGDLFLEEQRKNIVL